MSIFGVISLHCIKMLLSDPNLGPWLLEAPDWSPYLCLLILRSRKKILLGLEAATNSPYSDNSLLMVRTLDESSEKFTGLSIIPYPRFRKLLMILQRSSTKIPANSNRLIQLSRLSFAPFGPFTSVYVCNPFHLTRMHPVCIVIVQSFTWHMSYYQLINT